MLLIHDGKVKEWESVGDPKKIAKGFNIALMQRSFLRPVDRAIRKYSYVVGKEGVTIFAITANDQIILKEEFKQGTARIGLECPSGVMDEGESPMETARRELLEETGYEAGSMFVVPGRFVFGERKFPCGYRLVMAMRCERIAEPSPEPGEAGMSVYLATASEFWSAIRDERIIACQTAHAAAYAAANGFIKFD